MPKKVSIVVKISLIFTRDHFYRKNKTAVGRLQISEYVAIFKVINLVENVR